VLQGRLEAPGRDQRFAVRDDAFLAKRRRENGVLQQDRRQTAVESEGVVELTTIA
jgi:hypothetical protein